MLTLHSHGQNLFELKAEMVPGYTESAIIYDHMMRDVDYKRWAEYIVQLMKFGGLDAGHSSARDKRLCELGSGTGNIAFHLSKYGFEVTCVDSSSQMLDIARTKSSQRKKSRLDFLDHDMVTYQAKSPYDGIVCVYDSINYISGQNKLELFFKNVFLNLKSKGVFIFDASLEPNSVNSPELFVQRGRIKKIHYQRESSYDPGTRMHTTRIRVKRNGTVFEEIHKEYVYDIGTLRQVAERAGFTEKFAAGDFTMLEATDNSERVHFVLTKETHD